MLLDEKELSSFSVMVINLSEISLGGVNVREIILSV